MQQGHPALKELASLARLSQSAGTKWTKEKDNLYISSALDSSSRQRGTKDPRESPMLSSSST